MKYSQDIIKEMSERGQIEVPKDCVGNDGFDEWIHKERKENVDGSNSN